MNGGVFLIQQDESLTPLKVQAYETELVLQQLVSRYPDLLDGEQIDPDDPRRWLVVADELGVPMERDGSDRLALDHLFLDQDGIPTLIEVKRSSDTRIRREVVGQMLDYAANAVYVSIEKIKAHFEQTCSLRKQNPEELLKVFLGSELEAGRFWETVKTNLEAGKVRLIFVADEIPPSLQLVVEFLNRQMNPAEVLAVEIKQFVGQGQRTMVSRVIGNISEAGRKRHTTPRGKEWDAERLISELKIGCGDAEAEVAKKMLIWANAKALKIVWGRGLEQGSFSPIFVDEDSKNCFSFSVWTVGTVEIVFQWLNSKVFENETMRLELRTRLNEIEGVNIPEKSIHGRPSFRLTALTAELSLRKFLDAMNWYFEKVGLNSGK